MKISKRGMEALRECQVHWDRIAEPDPDEPMDASACALCQEFNYIDNCQSRDTGEVCPVRRATGVPGCRNTNYIAAVVEHGYMPHDTTARRAMRDFLYALPDMDDVLEDHRAITIAMEQEQSND